MTGCGRSQRRKVHGFSLIELAVVLVIVGLLVGGGLAALNAGTEQARRAEQRQQLRQIEEALYGFAMTEGRLPCADTDYPAGPSDQHGVENYDEAAGACEDEPGPEAERGALPWATLGVGRRDAWGHVLYYEVAANPTGSTFVDYADDPEDGEDSSFGFDAVAHLNIDDEDGDPVADGVPAVVVSFGPQGGQVWTSGGFVCPATSEGFSDDERANCDNHDTNRTFVDAGYRTPDSSAGRFDDMLMWLSDSALKARMVEAGKLP